MKGIKSLILTAVSLPIILFTACNTDNEPENLSATPISFSVTTVHTRSGELTDATLSSLGVFAYTDGKQDYNETTTQLNYIFNVEIAKTTVWKPASPIYWPLNIDEKLTFFAYAPHSDKLTGGNSLSLPAFNSAGVPRLTFTNKDASTDFLFAVPQANLTKATSTVNFRMSHAMTKVSIYISNTGSRKKKITGLTLKAKEKGTFFYLPSSTLKYQAETTDYITYGETASYSVELPGNDASNIQLIQSYYLLPDRTGAVLTLTYTEYTDDADTSGTEYKVVISDSPDTSAGEIPFNNDIQLKWASGASIAYQLTLNDK